MTSSFCDDVDGIRGVVILQCQKPLHHCGGKAWEPTMREKCGDDGNWRESWKILRKRRVY